MREIRLSGLEGGGTELNRSFLPLSRYNFLDGRCGPRENLVAQLREDGGELSLMSQFFENSGD
jgi:hypothetical protein